jgi:hypothetical protein
MGATSSFLKNQFFCHCEVAERPPKQSGDKVFAGFSRSSRPLRGLVKTACCFFSKPLESVALEMEHRERVTVCRSVRRSIQ